MFKNNFVKIFHFLKKPYLILLIFKKNKIIKN